MPESFKIRVTKDHLGFCSGHFITYDGDHCERLHGHNYRTAVEIARDFRFSNRQVSREEPAGSSTTAYSIHFTPRNRCFTPKV